MLSKNKFSAKKTFLHAFHKHFELTALEFIFVKMENKNANHSLEMLYCLQWSILVFQKFPRTSFFPVPFLRERDNLCMRRAEVKISKGEGSSPSTPRNIYKGW